MNRQLAISILEKEGSVLLRCNGNSMQPIMAPGDRLYIKKVGQPSLRVGDAVFCKLKSGLQVHKISAISGDRFQISNNRGYVNGTISSKNIFGLCTQVNERILVSSEELEKRLK